MHNFLFYPQAIEDILFGMAEKEQFHDRLRLVADALGTRREAAEIGGVSLDAIIRYLRGENQPGFLIISRMCEAAGYSMHWLATGKEPMQLRDLKSPPPPLSRGVPVTGFAESKEEGWYNSQPSAVQTSLDMVDPAAFAAVVHGQGLIPEGIHPGFLCVCSPMLNPLQGDIVHLRRKDGLCALKLFLREEGEWLVLKAYTDKDAKGGQRPYEDRVKRSIITEISPVVFVRRRV
jgi:hypothetical protein